MIHTREMDALKERLLHELNKPIGQRHAVLFELEGGLVLRMLPHTLETEILYPASLVNAVAEIRQATVEALKAAWVGAQDDANDAEAELKEHIERDEARRKRIGDATLRAETAVNRVLGFASSCIKSGESWSDDAQALFDAVPKAWAELITSMR